MSVVVGLMMLRHEELEAGHASQFVVDILKYSPLLYRPHVCTSVATCRHTYILLHTIQTL